MKNYYYLLGVEHDAEVEDIKKAYRKLASKFHPDANQGDAWFEERFKEIQEAYYVLINPESRSDYDLELQASFQQVYTQSPINVSEAQRREEMINFKEEVLRRKQEELDAREAALNHQWRELQQWYNKYALTRFIYQRGRALLEGLFQTQLSGHNRKQLFSAPVFSRIRNIFPHQKGFLLLIVSVLSLALFGFLRYRHQHPIPPPTTNEAGEAQVNDFRQFQGTIDGFEATFNMKWKAGTDSLYGHYFFEREPKTIYELRGVSFKKNKLKLRAYQDHKLITQIGLEKNLTDTSFCLTGKMFSRGGLLMNVNLCEVRN